MGQGDLLVALSLTELPPSLSTTRDTNLNGFYIPKGRCVFVEPVADQP